MELIYLWVEEYKNIKNQGFNFSPRFECEFKAEYEKDENGEEKLIDNCELIIEHKQKYYFHIFPENINVTAIVGKNGSGKSSIITMLHNKVNTKEQGSKKYIIIATIKKDKEDEFLYWGNAGNINCDKSLSYMDLQIPRNAIQILNNKTTEWHHYFKYLNGEDKFFGKINYSDSPTNDNTDIFIPKYVIAYKKFFYLLVLEEFYSFDTLVLKLIDIDLNKIENEEYRKNCEVALDKFERHIHKIIGYVIFKYVLLGKKEEEIELFLKNINNINTIKEMCNVSSYDGNFSFALNEGLKYVLGLQWDYKHECQIKLQELTEEQLTYLSIFQKTYDGISINLPAIKLGLLNSTNNVSYEQISDGEKQFTRLLTEILTHKEYSQDGNAIYLFDEVENYLHPQWQKKYIKYIIDIFEKLKKNVHLIFTSHSPFLLSDIPAQNVIFLDRDEKGNCKVIDGLKDKKQTFGANIHTLLSDAFFMEDGLIGEFAKEKINKVIELLNQKELSKEGIEYCENIISIIGEPIIKRQLQKMLDSKRLSKIDKISEIENQIAKMQEELNILKAKQNG